MDRTLGPGYADAGAWLADALMLHAARIRSLVGEGAAGESDPYLGAFISPERARRLAAEAGKPPVPPPLPDSPEIREAAERLGRPGAVAALPLGQLIRAFGLPHGIEPLASLMLAPELDARFARLFAYLNDDAGRRHLTPALAMRLLGTLPFGTAALLAEDAPLRVWHLVEHPAEATTSLIDRPLRWTDRIARFLLGSPEGQPGDAALDGYLRAAIDCPLEALLPEPETRAALRQAAMFPRLVLIGPTGAGRMQIAGALARESGRAPLVLDGPALAREAPAQARRLLRIALREATLANGTLVLVEADRLARPTLAGALGAAPCPFIATSAERLDLSVPSHMIPALDAPRAEAVWAAALGPGTEATVVQLAQRYHLPVGDILEVAREAGPAADARRLAEACRVRSSRALDSMAMRVEPRHDWDDLVLPARQVERLRGIVTRVEQAHCVYDDWGFGEKLAPARKVSVLFLGPSGAGKTLSAGVIARALGLALYRVDLAATVSKYIGETEKNLERIFSAAEAANAVLFFDEADALFGKRSEVKDAHDRYANIETSFLLQRIESYRGVAILATNNAQNIDEAFTRRIDVIVEFALPDAEARTRLWQKLMPPKAEVADDVDQRALGERFELAGGEIRNALIAAAFMAAAEGGPITMAHCLRAVAEGYEKIGRPLTRTDFGEAFATVRPRRRP